MIPLALTIKGLYSYQSEQHIDFTQLTEAGIFGLFGKVGSGKSTILEAISYAVYGRTERMNISGDDRNYNMMNLKSNELLIDFRFNALKNEEYKAVVHGKRNSKRFDDVKKYERQLYKKQNNAWIPLEEDANIDEIVGLSYDNFKRTIIIPQGKFQEFLQLSNTERTQMLKELFHLEKFELSGKVNMLISENNQKIATLKGKLEQLGSIDPELIKTKKDQELKLREELDKHALLVKKTQEETNEYKQLKTLHDKYTSLKLEYGKLEKRIPEIKLKQNQLDEYELCYSKFYHLLKDEERIKKQAKELENTIRSMTENHSSLVSNKKLLNEKLNELSPKYENRELTNKKIEELNAYLQVRELENENNQLVERLNKGKAMLDSSVEGISELKQQKKANREKLEQLKLETTNIQHLSEFKNWNEINNQHEKVINETQNELNETIEHLNKINNELNDIHELVYFKDSKSKLTPADCKLVLVKRKEEINKAKTQLEKESEKLIIHNQLAQFANELEEGKACPLCGSEHHPNIWNNSSADGALKEIYDIKADLNTELTSIDELRIKLEKIANDFIEKQKLQARLNLKLQQQQQEQQQHQQKYRASQWLHFNIKTVDKQLEQAQHEQEEFGRLDTQLKQLENSIEEQEKNREKFAKAYETLITRKAVLKSQIGTKHKKFKYIEQDKLEKLTNDEINKLAENVTSQLESVIKQYENTDKQIQEINQSISKIEGQIDANTIQQKELRNEQTSIQEKQKREINSSQYTNRQEIIAILSLKLDVFAVRKEIQEFERNLHSIKIQLTELTKQIGERTYSEELFKQMLDKLAHAEKVYQEQSKELGSLQKEIIDSEKRLSDSVNLHSELEKIELRAENLKTMSGLFRASGFVNYVSTVHLRNLVAAANERFYKLTRQALQLELSENNTFLVRDFLNEGKVRSVKTLSGGQTFQASLCLALALSDNIQKQSSTGHNFFFLDEGFGSLDSESLQVVFDTLKSLRKENRIVGVISHVEEMQQEIDVHLHVENHPETGSIIKYSWA